ncbi:MAG: glycoside hydrolase family 95 protein, partial [Prevotella sp.]|nr:glycoside hydrolase family 95 protein [Prevotella sp.]
MRKRTILFSLLFTLFVTSVNANVLVLNQRGNQVNSITNNKYYVIAGYAQDGSTTNFLYDTGAGIKATSLTTGTITSNLFVWRLKGNANDGYIIQNMSTGNYMNLGSSDGSAITMGAVSQNLSIVFDANNYAMIYNTSTNQAIDVGWNGTSPITWTADNTPTGSRRLFIYEAEMAYRDLPDWSVNLPTGYMSVGCQATTMVPAAAGTDNDHWYIITQVRGGESAMYDVGAGQTLKRGDTSMTSASLNGTTGNYAADYLVRFVPTETNGVYHIQFANGHYITSDLTTGTIPANYFFYNINGTTDHFGWNITSDGSTYGSIVDNNGAGYTLAFWDSGKVTATSGNNNWYIYPVTFFENGDYTWYTIQNKNAGYLSLNSEYMDGNKLLLTNTTRPGDRKALWRVERQSNGTYRFYNYTTGPDRVLAFSGSEANARAQMVDASIPADDATYTTYFTFYDESAYTNGTEAYIRLGASGSNYWNKRGNYLALWNSTWAVGDSGSTFYFTEADPDDYDDQAYSEFYAVNGVNSFEAPHPLTLWYNQPSTKTGVSNEWMEYALPIGNGQLGATEQGKIYTDEIQFNEKTLWTGTSSIKGNPNHGCYRNFGSVMVRDISNTFSLEDDSAPVQNYLRYLDIEDAIAGVQFQSPDLSTTYKREYLSSNPDQVIAAHYTSEGGKKLNLRFTYEPGSGINASMPVYTDGTASFSGKLDIVSYHTMFKVISDGTVTTSDTKIVVSDATEVLLLLTGGTDYNGLPSDGFV